MLDLRQELRYIEEDLRSRSIPEEVIGAVKSSIASTVTDLHSQTRSNSEMLTSQLMDQLHNYAGSLGTICHELNASHCYDQAILQNLVDRYDHSTTESTDGFLAYGNELVMLRLMVQACVDRINLLIANRNDIPNIPFGSPPTLGPQAMDMVIAEINNDYAKGVDMTQLGTNVDLTPSGGQADPAPIPQTRELTQSPHISDQLPFEGSTVDFPPHHPTALESPLGLTDGQATSGRPPDETASGQEATTYQSDETRTTFDSVPLKTDKPSEDTPESQSLELATGDAALGGAVPTPNVTTPALSSNTPPTEEWPLLMGQGLTTMVEPPIVDGHYDAGTSDGTDSI